MNSSEMNTTAEEKLENTKRLENTEQPVTTEKPEKSEKPKKNDKYGKPPSRGVPSYPHYGAPQFLARAWLEANFRLLIIMSSCFCASELTTVGHLM